MEKRYRQNYVMGRIIRKIQKNGLLAIVEWVMGYTYHHAELRYYTKELYQRPGIFFLTYKDGVRYLQNTRISMIRM